MGDNLVQKVSQHWGEKKNIYKIYVSTAMTKLAIKKIQFTNSHASALLVDSVSKIWINMNTPQVD